MSAVSTQTGVAPSLRMTEDEFVRWASEDTHAEWVNGEVQLKMPIDRLHGALQFWLRTLVQSFVTRRKLGFVEGPQFTLRLPPKPSRRDPDVLFVETARESLVHDTYVDGPADLVIEVVSPESTRRDYHEKFFEYEAAGVREYWIVDPLSQSVSMFTLGAGGKYEMTEPKNDRLHSAVLPGLWINVADPFKNPLPDVQQLLADLGS